MRKPDEKFIVVNKKELSLNVCRLSLRCHLRIRSIICNANGHLLSVGSDDRIKVWRVGSNSGCWSIVCAEFTVCAGVLANHGDSQTVRCYVRTSGQISMLIPL